MLNWPILASADIDILLFLGCVTKIQIDVKYWRQPKFHFLPKRNVNLTLYRRPVTAELYMSLPGNIHSYYGFDVLLAHHNLNKNSEVQKLKSLLQK